MSIPMLVISIIMFYILASDYKINHNSFLAKSRFYSQLPNSDIDAFYKIQCSNDYNADREKFKCK